ncbi:MAG: FHA domain-containing protein [Phycisphaerae bacterium]|nr:FHA domain-containing protein [Phycisphaerae bacterium]
MAEIIFCPCGEAIETARTDVLEAVHCPVCRTELDLDLTINGQRRRGFLTITGGPDRIGERLLLPVGKDLTVGSLEGSWLYLLDDSVAAQHCTFRLAADGRLEVFVGSSYGGKPSESTASNVIQPNQVLRIGSFQLRYSIEDVAPSPVVIAPPSGARAAMPRAPVLQSITRKPSPFDALMKNRFQIARTILIVLGALLAVDHLLRGVRNPDGFDPYNAFWAVAFPAAYLTVARRIGLAGGGWNYSACGLALLAAMVETIFSQPTAGIAMLLTSGALFALLQKNAYAPLVSVGTLVSTAAGVVLAISLVRGAPPERKPTESAPTTTSAADAV